MHPNKFILILLLVLFDQKGPASKTVMVAHNYPETLSGKVKVLIEIRTENSGTESGGCITDTTYFDGKGNATETRSGSKGHICEITRYMAKSDDRGKVTGINKYGYVNRTVYEFDHHGNITSSVSGVVKSSYKYDAHRNLIESISFIDSNRIISKEQYRYNARNYLIAQDVYQAAKHTDTFTYTYILVDKKKNWLKRIETSMQPGNFVARKDTVERKITYY